MEQTVCNYLHGLDTTQITNLSSIAGMPLSDDAAKRIWSFATKGVVTPRGIARSVKFTKRIVFVGGRHSFARLWKWLVHTSIWDGPRKLSKDRRLWIRRPRERLPRRRRKLPYQKLIFDLTTICIIYDRLLCSCPCSWSWFVVIQVLHISSFHYQC